MQIKRKERISSKIVPLTIYEKFISIELRSKLETVPCQIAIDHSLISQQVKNQRLARYTYALLQNLSSQARYHDHVHSETPKILYIYTHTCFTKIVIEIVPIIQTLLNIETCAKLIIKSIGDAIISTKIVSKR